MILNPPYFCTGFKNMEDFFSYKLYTYSEIHSLCYNFVDIRDCVYYNSFIEKLQIF